MDIDIVDFVEKYLGIKLLKFQKIYLRHIENEKHQDKLFIIPRGGRTTPYIIWYILYKWFLEEYKDEIRWNQKENKQ